MFTPAWSMYGNRVSLLRRKTDVFIRSNLSCQTCDDALLGVGMLVVTESDFLL